MATSDQTVGAVLDATNKRYVVETGSSEDGSSHFTLYSDGWLEQSGYVTSNLSSFTTIPLMKPYSDKNYNVIVNREPEIDDSDGWGETSGVCYPSKTESSFPVSLYSPGYTSAISWEACGYSA